MPEDPTLNEDSKVFQITTQCITVRQQPSISRLNSFRFSFLFFCACLPQSCSKKPVLKRKTAELLDHYYLTINLNVIILLNLRIIHALQT